MSQVANPVIVMHPPVAEPLAYAAMPSKNFATLQDALDAVVNKSHPFGAGGGDARPVSSSSSPAGSAKMAPNPTTPDEARGFEDADSSSDASSEEEASRRMPAQEACDGEAPVRARIPNVRKVTSAAARNDDEDGGNDEDGGSPPNLPNLVGSDDDDDDDEDDEARRPEPEPTGTLETGRWSSAEHQRFLEGLNLYGRRKWQKIAELVGTRTTIQVRSHAQKYFKKIRKEAEAASPHGFAAMAGGMAGYHRPRGGSHTRKSHKVPKDDLAILDDGSDMGALQIIDGRGKPRHMSGGGGGGYDQKYFPASAYAQAHHVAPNVLKRNLCDGGFPLPGGPRREPSDEVVPQRRFPAIADDAPRATRHTIPSPAPASSTALRKKRRTLDDLCKVASIMLNEDSNLEKVSRATLPTLDSPATTLARDDQHVNVIGYRDPGLVFRPLEAAAARDYFQHKAQPSPPPPPMPAQLTLPVPYRTKPFVHHG